jgi:hypothetical protein
MKLFARRIQIAIIAFLMIPLCPLFAHHSFSAEYNITQPIELKGTITSVEWTNPHAFVTIAVADSDGKTKESRGEGGALSLLQDSGWTPEMLQQVAKSKSVVIVSGYRARSGTSPVNGMWVKAIELPDGRKFVFN